jgi:peptidoglycan/xylan/chitin deacetylase (PgdA/CDA1 family)
MKKQTYILTILAIVIAITVGLYFFRRSHKEILSSNLKAQVSTPLPLSPIEQNTYIIRKNTKIVPQDPKGNKKIVLVTIDDGPSAYTENILSILKKHNMKAIFFINGFHNKGYPEGIAAEFKAGNPIGNHTWDHPNLSKIKEETIVKEIDDDSKLITTITGAAPRFFRPPYGVSTPFVKDYVHKNNMIFMNWSGAASDWEPSAKQEDVFMKNVMQGLSPGDIILLHEHSWTVSYLDALLTAIEQKGYTFADPNNIVE